MSDYQAGLTAASAIMTALFAREDTGRGQHVDIAAFEPWATYHAGATVTTFVYQGVTGHRDGRRRPDLYPYTLLPCKDGLLCLIAREGRQWKRFLVDVMQREDLADHERYRNRRVVAEEYPEEMDALLSPWLMERTREEIFELCRKHRVPFAPVRRIDEVLNDPHLAERGFFRTIDHPVAGSLPYTGAPFQMSETPWSMHSAAPTLGEANEEVFGVRLGCSKEALNALQLSSVI
jgi:crotonobetainyl-CoA:carnitine CoA-transferase CaiB-like acyl-CoA transferase